MGQYPKLRIDAAGKIYDANRYEYAQIDSSKYYFNKYTYYKGKLNDELEKINRLQNPKMTRKIFMYQDSCTRYHDLLQKLKK